MLILLINKYSFLMFSILMDAMLHIDSETNQKCTESKTVTCLWKKPTQDKTAVFNWT